MADIESVANWYSKQVVNWFKGLDEDLQCYVPNLEEAAITGAQLLALHYEDLNNLGIIPIGHQELVLEATELLKQLHFDIDTENLQSRALDLNCKCRALRSSITSRRRNLGGHDSDIPEALRRGPNVQLLRSACDVLDSSKLMVMWLDRPPFFSQPDMRRVRANIVKLSYELSTTVQQSVFACVIEDAALSICGEMEGCVNQLIVSSDPMTIQPSSLETAHLVNRDSSAGLGLFIKATFEGHHVITGTKEGSISSKIRRIGLGDEVVAVSGQTVVGWQLSKLVAALKESPNDISITLKKRPHFAATNSAVTPTQRRQHNIDRSLTVAPPVSPIRKVADSRKNSVEDTINSSMDSAFNLSITENLKSPKKQEGKKKKKLKKQKAKSSSNILASTGNKKSKRNSVNSFESNEGSMQSASSNEGVLSISTGNLTRHIDLRKNLERVLGRERPESADVAGRKTKSKDKRTEHKRKKGHGSVDDLLKLQGKNARAQEILKEMNFKQLKRKAQGRSVSYSDVLDRKDSLSSTPIPLNNEPMIIEPPSSPLDMLVIPPPPPAPYTPRPENNTPLTIESLDTSYISNDDILPNQHSSESPNSILDIEQRRRFTVIGSEQMDDKWYESLLSQVNTKRAKREKASAKQVLEKLDETTASDDSVFFKSTNSPEKEVVKRRPQKPPRRNRPMSMPPNYYSPTKLQQYRANKGKLLTAIPDESSIPADSSKILPMSHHVNDNGVKKLAPLNYTSESPQNTVQYRTPNDNRDRRSPSQRHSWSLNSNNSNNGEVGNSPVKKNQSKIPPKPPVRSTSKNLFSPEQQQRPASATPRSTTATSSPSPDNMPFKENKPKDLDKLPLDPKSSGRPKSATESQNQYVGLLQIKPQSGALSDRSDSPIRRNRSKTDASSETTSPEKRDIADELSKYLIRKRSGLSSSGDPFSPPPVTSSPIPLENDTFVLSKTQSKSVGATPTAKTPMMPPVAKPRTKLTTPTDKVKPPAITFDSPKDNALQPGGSKKDRSKSFDFSESPKSKKKEAPPPRRKSEEVTKKMKPVKLSEVVIPKPSAVSQLARASPSSRGSYVAAIDVGYALENLKNTQQSKNDERKAREPSHSGSFSKDTDEFGFKVIDGVKVKLRKGPSSTTSSKSSGKKKIAHKVLGIDRLKTSDPDMRSRRVSCRDLGQGECDGWLWKKKTSANSPLTSKWSKRWVVLKDGALYCYHTDEDDKAESYIYLPGYQVTPAVESKKRYAFRVSHPLRKTFYFASDRQMDMSRWMNKMGLAAIEYGTPTSSPATSNGDRVNEKENNKEKDYYSESDSEEAFISQSETSNHSSTPSSSPEKTVKLETERVKKTAASMPKRKPGSRHVSTQPVLNRSARFPKNKAQQLQESKNTSAETQTTDSIEKNLRNRSKSEAPLRTKKWLQDNNGDKIHTSSASLDANDNLHVNVSPDESPFTSPIKKPAVNADQRKHKTDDKRRKQYLESSHLSSSLEAVNASFNDGMKPAHSEEELQHLKRAAAKKAEEMQKKSSNTSLASNQSSENVRAVERDGNLTKNKPLKSVKICDDDTQSKPSRSQSEANVKSPNRDWLPRRDIAGRPKVKASDVESRPRNSSSIDDLCKALQHAEVDIHGVNRRTTLRRKMTILSRDPKKNELMLKKRALQRQLKALEGELEYYNLLDEKTITSQVLHEWINQQPSIVAELGTIRKMSKIRRKPAEQAFSNIPEDNDSEDIEQGSSSGNSEAVSSQPVEDSPNIGNETVGENTIPVPVKRRSKALEKNENTPIEQNNPLNLEVNLPTTRPRSCAMSNTDYDRMKPRAKTTASPTKDPVTPRQSLTSRTSYLETDL
uniref:uncharacterized protein LOC120338655 isoform X1 n=1 Tax=Styela clava TaxID=7725 RepID=UPI00193AD0F9|nr:uncharacterized protein LOC120338655 isoform X1 [Styela clava]